MRGGRDDVRALIHDVRNVEFKAVMRLHVLSSQRVGLIENGALLLRSIAAARTTRMARRRTIS